jgi:hypothetical protein
MNYSLGYDERCTDTFLARGAEQQCLNLAPFVHTFDDGSASEQFDGILSALRARLASSDSLVTSNEPLATDLRAALRRKVVLSDDEYARVNTLITLYIRKFHGDAQPKVAWIRCPGSHPDAWEPNTLYGRYGNVELRVLENWLQDREGLLVEYRKVMEQRSDEDYMYCDQASRHWLSSDDKNYNLRKLMTNAGFYPGLVDGEEDLNCWAEEFLAALAASKSLFSYPMAYPFYFATHGHLFAKYGVIADYINSTMDAVHIALKGAQLTATEIDEIILVGGSTRTPCIRERLFEEFGFEPHSEVNPDLCVAMGAECAFARAHAHGLSAHVPRGGARQRQRRRWRQQGWSMIES